MRLTSTPLQRNRKIKSSKIPKISLLLQGVKKMAPLKSVSKDNWSF